jgi:hypothetical protein
MSKLKVSAGIVCFSAGLLRFLYYKSYNLLASLTGKRANNFTKQLNPKKENCETA